MRALSAIFAAAVVLTTSLVAQAQTPGDRKPPVIKHTPVASATEGSDVGIVAEIVDDSGIFAPMLWYRAPGAETYSSVDLVLQADKTYLATIPVKEPVEYWLEAYDELGNGPARAGTPEKPFRIAMKAAPAPANTLIATSTRADDLQGAKSAPGAPPLTFVAVTPDPAFDNSATPPTSLLKAANAAESKSATTPVAESPKAVAEAAPAPTKDASFPPVPAKDATPAPSIAGAPVVTKEGAPAPTAELAPAATPPALGVAENPVAEPAPAVVEAAPKPAEVDLTAPGTKKKKSKSKDSSKATTLAAKPAETPDLSAPVADTKPIYKRWWFVGGTGVVAAAGVGLLVYALLPNTIDQNVFSPTMRRP